MIKNAEDFVFFFKNVLMGLGACLKCQNNNLDIGGLAWEAQLLAFMVVIMGRWLLAEWWCCKWIWWIRDFKDWLSVAVSSIVKSLQVCFLPIHPAMYLRKSLEIRKYCHWEFNCLSVRWILTGQEYGTRSVLTVEGCLGMLLRYVFSEARRPFVAQFPPS